jgi:tetratricopeptide (TPR) repeat protein
MVRRMRDARSLRPCQALEPPHYRKTLDRDPTNGSAWVQYGRALKDSGHLRAAEDAYRKALGLAPKVADTHLQLGHALKLQDHKQAEAGANSVSAAGPTPPIKAVSSQV